MEVHVHTDNHITGREALIDRVTAEVEGTLARFDELLTRVEVHLHDDNGPKHGSNDKRCVLEARLSGHPPLSAHHEAEGLDAAITGAIDKLERVIDHTLDKLGHKKGRTSYGGDQKI